MSPPTVQDRFDSGSRYLIKLQPDEVIAWRLRGDVTFCSWLDTRAIPFPGSPERICDTVARCEGPAGEPWAVVIESQTRPDPDMFGRMMSYLGQLSVEKRPDAEPGSRFHVAAIVINLTGRGSTSRDFRLRRSRVRTCLCVDECNLAELNAASILHQIAAGMAPRSLLGWIPLMKRGAEPATLKSWRRLAEADPERRRRADYGILALLFAELAGSFDVWRTHLEDWNVVESQFVLGFMKESQLKTLRRVLSGLLRNRFGSLPDAVSRRIEDATDPDRLEAAVLQAPALESLDDLTL
jgi:hypothetical protein